MCSTDVLLVLPLSPDRCPFSCSQLALQCKSGVFPPGEFTAQMGKRSFKPPKVCRPCLPRGVALGGHCTAPVRWELREMPGEAAR